MLRKWLFLPLLLALIFLLSVARLHRVLSDPDTKPDPKPEPTPVASTTPKIALPAALLRVCSCESNGRPDRQPRQFNADGSVVLGHVNPRDVGACQINLDAWGVRAVNLGFDLWTEAGNFQMATWIYDRYGLQPWSWSQACWAPKK